MVFDLEAYALTSALQHWRRLLMGMKVVCVTDHKGLSALINPAYPIVPKVRRWIADLTGFDIEIRHIPGDSAEMLLSDWLSRPSQTTLLEARAALADRPEVRAQSNTLIVPKGSALVAALKVAHSGPWQGLPPILQDILSRTAAKRLRGGLRATLLERSKASAWRWCPPTDDQKSGSTRNEDAPSRALRHFRARQRWLKAAELESEPMRLPEVTVCMLSMALPSTLEDRIRNAYAGDPAFPPKPFASVLYRKVCG